MMPYVKFCTNVRWLWYDQLLEATCKCDLERLLYLLKSRTTLIVGQPPKFATPESNRKLSSNVSRTKKDNFLRAEQEFYYTRALVVSISTLYSSSSSVTSLCCLSLTSSQSDNPCLHQKILKYCTFGCSHNRFQLELHLMLLQSRLPAG